MDPHKQLLPVTRAKAKSALAPSAKSASHAPPSATRKRPEYVKVFKTKEEQKQFLEAYQRWKAGTKLEVSTQEFQMQDFMKDFKPLPAGSVRELVAWLPLVEYQTTAGHKVYLPLTTMTQVPCASLATEFDAIGERLLEMLNEGGGEGVYARMKQQDVLLLTFGPHMDLTIMTFDEKLQKFVGQLPHVDAPAEVVGISAGVSPIVSAIVSLTDRSATQHSFDLSLRALLQGKTWST